MIIYCNNYTYHIVCIHKHTEESADDFTHPGSVLHCNGVPIASDEVYDFDGIVRTVLRAGRCGNVVATGGIQVGQMETNREIKSLWKTIRKRQSNQFF